MDLNELRVLLRKRWRTVVILTVAGVLAALAVTYLMTPKYTAVTRMHFAVQGGESVADLAQGSAYTEKQMGSYVEAARSSLVLDDVIDELGLETDSRSLAETIDATVPDGTMVLAVAATHTDATTAANIANAVAAGLSEVSGQLSPPRADGSDSVVATVLTPASAPDAPSSPRLRANLAAGLAIGLLLGLVVATLRHALDTKLRGDADVAAVTRAPLLGRVTFEKDAAAHRLYMREDPAGHRAEALRRLRTNLKFVARSGELSPVLVTSSMPGEGKTTTAINLALSLADAGGSRVLLVDADLRRPAVAKYLGMEGSAGLTTVLIGRADPADVVQPLGDTSVDVLTSGEVPPNPAELLDSPEMAALLESLAKDYDVVILDSAPLLPVTDAAVLSKLAAGTLVLASGDDTTRPQLRQSLALLEMLDARVLGIVLNKVRDGERRNSYYYPTQEGQSGPHVRSGRRGGRPAGGRMPR